MNDGAFVSGGIFVDRKDMADSGRDFLGSRLKPEPKLQSGVSGFSGGTAGDHSPQRVIWLQDVSPSALSSLAIAAEPGSSAKAIFSEITTGAKRLLADGESSSIDLRFLKSMPEERAILDGLLGRGEVSAVVDSIGRSRVIETAIPCVWWIQHFNSDGEMVGELIEIADLPELLMGDRSAIAFALQNQLERQFSGTC